MKAGLVFPSQLIDVAKLLILSLAILGGLLSVHYFRLINHVASGKKLFSVAGIIFLMIGIDLGNPVSLAIVMPLVLSSFFGILKRSKASANFEEEENPADGPIGNEKEIQSLKAENDLLKKRILETPNTLTTQAKFFENLLSLNEIQLMQGVVESTAHFLNADQVSLYRYEKSTTSHFLAARYNHLDGQQLDTGSQGNDRIFSLIGESRQTLSFREINRNVMLHDMWRKSYSRAIVYSPVYHENLFVGILTIDQIAFQHFNRETARNLQAIAELTGLAFRNILASQRLLIEKNEAKSKLLTQYQEFLVSLNSEFKRASRSQIPLSLLYIVIESSFDGRSHQPASVDLAQQIQENCRKNLREVDMLFEGGQPGQFWVILPFTDFNGLSYVMERVNLTTNMDLADQTQFSCHMGFCSLYAGIQQPRQMIVACQDSLQLHRTVVELGQRSREKAGTLSDSTQA